MFIVKHRLFFSLISALLVIGSVVAIAVYGLNLGTDFKGGTIMELEYATSTRPTAAAVTQALAPLDVGSVAVQSAGETGLLLRLRAVTETEHAVILSALNSLAPATEKRFSTIGPSLGAELARKGIVAVVLVSVLIILYIALAFRKVSRPVSSWKYGLIAIITLCHDVIITIGLFAVLGHFYGVEVDALFLTALLTLLGLSVNDTIVIFDRVRENLRHRSSQNFDEVVGHSLSQSFARSFNTSFTTTLVLVAVLLFGSETTRYFALALAFGMAVGTYSSLFLASPLLVAWQKKQN